MLKDPIPRNVRKVAAVVVLGSIMSILDATIVNVALETFGRELGAPVADTQWIVTGYLLALATAIPVSGWAARRRGAKQVYLAALVAFTLGSALCAAAWSIETLVAARVLQGLGGGMILPVGQMLLAREAGPQRMGRLMGVIGVPMILAPIFGPVTGGLLIEHLSWHWIFLVNVPLGAAALWLGVRLLPRVAPQDAGPLDGRGLALLGIGVPALVYGVSEVGTTGTFGAPQVVWPALAGAALIAAFVVHAPRAARPLLDVRLYRRTGFAAASATTFALGGALFGGMVLLPLYFQTVRGEDVVATGLLLVPQGVGAMIAMPLAGRLTDRIGAAPVALAGLALSVAGTVPLAFVGEHTSYVALGAALVLRGLGTGLAMVPAMSAAYATLAPEELPDAAPQLNVLQRVGGSIGTAVLAVVLQRALTGAAGPAEAAAAYGTAFWWATGITLLAVPPALVLLRAERAARRSATVAVPAVAA